MNASKFRLNVILSVLLALGLLFAAAPRGVSAEGGQTLNVAQWGNATQIDLAGRPTVLKVGSTYHMWYGANDTTLYHSSADSPTGFGSGTLTTYKDVTPKEVASPAIVEESGTYYMIAYGATTTVFNIYTSPDGNAWTNQGQVFDGTTITGAAKIDAPMLLADSGGYKLYFQVKSSATGNPYSIYVATATDTSLSDMAISASGKDFTLEKEVLPVGSADAWDDWRLQHPWVVKDGANYYMWYVGYSHASTVQKLGFAYSKDGINWTKSAGNPVFDTRVAEPAVINDSGTWHLWYLDPASKISYRSSSAPFTMIQDAINAAADDDTVNIAAGTYAEHAKNGVVTGTKASGKRINFTGETDGEDNPLPVILGSLEINLSSSPEDNVSVSNINFKVTDAATLNLYEVNGITIDNCSFDGSALFLNNGKVGVQFTSGGKGNSGAVIQNSVFNNGLYVGIQGYVNDLTVTGSDLYNIKSGINFQGGSTLEVNDTDISVIAQGITNDTYAVRFTSSATNQMTVNGGSFTVDRNGLTPNDGIYHSAIVVRGVAEGSHKVSGASINGEVVNLITTPLDASPNWWGSMDGPAAGQIVGEATYSPWCGDAACSFLVSKNDKGEFIIESEDVINVPGGIVIDQPDTTILLKNGTVIQNNSPCFIINANNTTIKAESIGGAQCVPTGGSNGIDVIAGISGLTVDGLEFVGTTGADGIHFAGAITDLLIVDNWFHGFASDGIEFNAQPAGVVQIQGNLFQNNTGLGINAVSYAVPATYNSWGHKDGATAGDGASTNVITSPYTHVDLYLGSTDVASNGQVASGKDVTYTVYGNFVNALGVDFKLKYPANLTLKETPTNSGIFTEGVVIDTRVANTIHFYGLAEKNLPVTGNHPIFSATFTTAVGISGWLDLDETSDAFAMKAHENSTNIFAAELVDYPVNIVAMPTITSSDIQGYYLTGDQQQFNVQTINPTDGGTYARVLFNYVIKDAEPTDITSFEYYDGADWHSLLPLEDTGTDLKGSFGPTGGFPMGTSYDVNTLFRITFAAAKSYPFELTLNDVDAGNYELVKFTNTAVVYNKPLLTSTTLAGPYQASIAKDFTLNVDNLSAMTGVTFAAHFSFPKDTLVKYGGNDYTCGETTGCLIPVTLAAGANPLTFNVTFPGAYSGDITATLYDTALDPDRALASLTQSVTVYANFGTITGTVSMQGRTFRGGVPMTLTGTLGFGPFNATSINQISNNLTFTDVAAGTYTITTSQPRYLNVTTDEKKTIDVTLKTAIAALELKGGNAVWTDNVIDLLDANEVGTKYGTVADIDADVNFSGKVDIFDLALVGGNFTLTSSVYSTWTP